ncbi:hypothetical protein RHMOL_Rhmol11G0244700 [Rhododendron molle]|uniref:Uncharacterized protein n=1 Tax=Rhododendron molle TaxID=49168 RepID=A0ACC0LVT1_RHOML|nr:hypothetical protein RHMOL_Rhmol11G0244700 [Rhododendron molle]
MDVEDQLTLSQLLLFGKNLIDFPPKIVSDNPCSGESHKRGREMVDTVSDHFDDHFEAESQVMARAAEVQDSLAPEFPSFRKFMTRSHVTKGFWLGLPTEFCKSHLPRLDAIVVLEDESGEEYNTKYLVDKKGLSAGWRWFSISHKLLEGDAVVFHLVSRLDLVKFKVYIVRAKVLEVADALSLPNSVACAKETGFEAYGEKNGEICEKEEKKRPRLELDDESDPDWNSHSSDTTEGSKFFGSNSDIKDFNIVVNGITIDSLSTHVRTKYYDLCCNQKPNIHEGLFNANMAAGIISETVNIADAIRASQISNSPDDFAIWDKTLEAFGLLGMDVRFLRDRLSRLVSLSSESREGSKRYAEIRIEREGVQKEMKSLELKLLGMKQDRRRLDDEMEDLEEEAQKYDSLFQKEASAPW